MPSLIKVSASRAVLALAVAASLASCAEVGPDFTRPAAPQTAGYAMVGDKPPVRTGDVASAPQGPWWNAFGSPELDATIKQALNDNPTLAEADATLAQLRANSAAVRGELGPQADANAGVERERINIAAFGFSGFPNPTITLYSIGGAVSYDLDLFGGGKRTLENAHARAETQAQRANAAYLSISGNVAMEAMAIARLRAEIAAIQSEVADDQQNLDMVKRAATLGGAAPAAGISATTQLAQDQAQLPALEQQLAQHRHMLALLVGKAPADYTPPDFSFDSFTLPGAIPVEVPSQLVRQRPDILAAEADLHAATAQIGVETAKLYPDVKLTGALTQGALEPGNLFRYSASGWNFGPSITLPIFHGGTLKANKRAAEQAALAANARYQQTVLKAFVEVADALQALAHDEDQVKATGLALHAAELNLHEGRLGYKLGGISLQQLLDAQRLVNTARRSYAEAIGQRLSDAVKLYLATGPDWQTQGVPPKAA